MNSEEDSVQPVRQLHVFWDHAFSQVRRRPTFDQFVAAGGGGGSFAFPSFGDRYMRLWKFSGCDSGCTMHEKELFDIRVLSTEIEDEY